ncbi:MAG: hypothetical protein ACYDBB_08630 [Armatimonadota bacterium]
MIELTNKLFQPLTFQRFGSLDGVHVGPRGRITLADEHVSEEMRRAERRGVITLRPVLPHLQTRGGK